MGRLGENQIIKSDGILIMSVDAGACRIRPRCKKQGGEGEG